MCDVADARPELASRLDRRAEVHAPQRRLSPQSRSKSLHVAQLTVVSLAGVMPGSIRDDPYGKDPVQPSSSEPRKRRLACACAAQKAADPDGYSAWSAV